MNNDIKILLTLFKEGGTCKFTGEKEVRKGVLTLKDLNPSRKFKGDEGNRIVKKFKYSIRPLESVESSQTIKMTVDAYDYMTSAACPEWFQNCNIKVWRKLSPKERLELHLDRTAKHFNAKRFTYSIVED